MKAAGLGPPIWRISVGTSIEEEQGTSELVESVFGQPAVSYTDAERRRVTVSAYFDTKPDPEKCVEFETGLDVFFKRGQRTKRRPRVSVEAVRREDWAESWKRHFRPMVIGSKLLLKPSWSRRKARRGQAVVVLDPGLSFGTGQHPTTAFCLEQLVAWRRAGEGQSFLDIGTGSGILAIAGAKLGYGPVDAFDVDAESVRVARANARRNRVERIRIVEQDLCRVRRGRRGYMVVCANLVADLLLLERERIVGRMNRGGLLVLAGILAKEFAVVQRAYEAAGLRLLSARTVREWRSGAFVKIG